MQNILWLPAWYPNNIEPLAGDFIQRHARAAALYNRVQVIHVLRDRNGIITQNIKEENSRDENLCETIIYYHSPKLSIGFLDKIVSNIYYWRIYKKAIGRYIKAYGLPAYTHLQIAEKNGSLALWLNRKYKIPLVLTEHWTIYMKNAKPFFDDLNIFFKWRWRRITNKISRLSVVSRHLGEAMKMISSDLAYTIIPNVFDQRIFYPIDKTDEPAIRFMHVSGLDYQKNPEDILQSLAIVAKTSKRFEFDIVGPEKPALQKLSAELGLEKQVKFHAEMPQSELARLMQTADALILYSRYETFGCVLIEANACGIPAIVSDLPVFHEILVEGENGFFAEGENPTALAKKILWFMENSAAIDPKRIAATAKEKYSFERVGKLFDDFYKSVLGSSS